MTETTTEAVDPGTVAFLADLDYHSASASQDPRTWTRHGVPLTEEELVLAGRATTEERNAAGAIALESAKAAREAHSTILVGPLRPLTALGWFPVVRRLSAGDRQLLAAAIPTCLAVIERQLPVAGHAEAAAFEAPHLRELASTLALVGTSRS